MDNRLKAITKHGHCKDGKCSPEYTAWHHMRMRCSKASDPRYHRYGGRGIKVCERWEDFEAFLMDMGPKPENTSLERIDNDGDYEPSNCVWECIEWQSANRHNVIRIEFNGVVASLSWWAKMIGIPKKALEWRLGRGKWDVRRALTTPSLATRRKHPTQPSI